MPNDGAEVNAGAPQIYLLVEAVMVIACVMSIVSFTSFMVSGLLETPEPLLLKASGGFAILAILSAGVYGGLR